MTPIPPSNSRPSITLFPPSHPARDPSNPPHLCLIFTREILHQVIDGAVLQKRISLHPGLIASNSSHQRRRPVCQSVAKAFGDRYHVLVGSQRIKKKIPTDAQVNC